MQADADKSKLEVSEGQLEVSEGQLRGEGMDGRMRKLTDGIFPHSTELCLLPGPLPKMRKG